MERRFRQVTVTESLLGVLLRGVNAHITTDAPEDIKVVAIDDSELQEFGRFQLIVFSESFEIVPPEKQPPELSITRTRHYSDPVETFS